MQRQKRKFSLQSSITHGAGPLLCNPSRSVCFRLCASSSLMRQRNNVSQLTIFPRPSYSPGIHANGVLFEGGKTRRPIALNVNSTALTMQCNIQNCSIARPCHPRSRTTVTGRYYLSSICMGRSVYAALAPLSPDGRQQTDCGHSVAESKWHHPNSRCHTNFNAFTVAEGSQAAVQ